MNIVQFLSYAATGVGTVIITISGISFIVALVCFFACIDDKELWEKHSHTIKNALAISVLVMVLSVVLISGGSSLHWR